ncbi:DNA-directed RNA polymerase subunit K [Candidatus Woesearchaeota archaeon]|nr:DNA-directed RNA polymerase subunit K [Candidatus Woesearchaeota archaeon]
MPKKKEELELNKYEKARILGSRSLQISMGAPYLVKLSSKKLEEIKYNSLEIAKLELEAGVVPIKVIRPMPVVPGK